MRRSEHYTACAWCGKEVRIKDVKAKPPLPWSIVLSNIDPSPSDESLHRVDPVESEVCSPACRNEFQDALEEARWKFSQHFDSRCPRRQQVDAT